MIATDEKVRLDSECFWGRHDFSTGQCPRPNCKAEWKNRVTIRAARWFQKSCGNTYHSVYIAMPDGTTLNAPYSYGYGEQYMDTALDLIRQHLEGPGANERAHAEGLQRIHEYLAPRGMWAEITCSDVERKRDL